MSFEDQLRGAAGAVEATLERLLSPVGTLAPGEPELWEAMRYATLGEDGPTGGYFDAAGRLDW